MKIVGKIKVIVCTKCRKIQEKSDVEKGKCTGWFDKDKKHHHCGNDEFYEIK